LLGALASRIVKCFAVGNREDGIHRLRNLK
jgi:hypothetical protein